MFSVCYLIVCVYLSHCVRLYSFDQDETLLPTRRRYVRNVKPYVYLKSLTIENQEQWLANIVCPYGNLTYDEQLDKKQSSSKAIVDRIVNGSIKIKSPIYKLLQIVPSPVTKAYRNNDVFKIRHGVDGNPKTVGLPVGSVKFRKIFSIPPTPIVTIRESHKIIAQVFEDFIRLSPLPASIYLVDGGHWKEIRIRSNEEGDIMASVIVHPKGYSKKTIKMHKQALKEYFFEHLPNISLFHQQCPYARCNQRVAPFSLLYGKAYFFETLNGYKFKITPDTSFKINTLAAQVLYDTIIRTSKLKPYTTILHINSGSGAISILASKFVREVVGIDSIPQVVTDARYNAAFNKIHNVKFLLERPMMVLQSVLNYLNNSTDIVAIVSTGNYRLGWGFIKTIRKSINISRLLYISNRPDSPNTVKNFIDLCSNKSDSKPFRLTKTIPVDLLPQSVRVELIFMFQR